MRSARIHLAYKNIKRMREIISVFVRRGFRPLMDRLRLTGFISLPLRVLAAKIDRREKGVTEAARLRLSFEELGPTFIKFGQILSTRPDIVPEEYMAELLKLQDEVPPFPFKDVLDVIERELGRPASELFSDIEERPVAAASIAQVHRAVTAGGEEVVIKVQRPGITGNIDTDISILRYLARLAVKYIPESRLYDPAGMVDEFSRIIRKELDFSLEASYTDRFRENFSDDPRVVVPRVHWDLTGKRVLTMERVHGIKVDKVERLKAEGIDTEKVAHLIADVFFKQVFVHGIFHGDLHSGNIFVISENKIALVDFGIVGRIDGAMKQNLADILIYFVSGDFDGLTGVYMKMGILPEGIDRAAFESEYYDIMLHYFGRPFRHTRMGELMMEYIRLAARHNVRLPRELLLFDKCMLELEGLARVLHPDVNILTESEPYAARLFKERISPAKLLGEGMTSLKAYGDFLNNFPSRAEQIMKQVMEGRLQIEFLHKGLEDFMGEMDRSSNRVTFGIIVAALVVGSSLVIASEAAPKVLGYPALGIIGFIIASLLGLWLAIQILRSGKF